IDPLERRRRAEWLLGEWAASALRGEAVKSQDLLAQAAAIGAEIEARSGDPLLSAAVGVVRRAERQGNRPALLALELGHAAFHAVRGDANYSECRLKTLGVAESQL